MAKQKRLRMAESPYTITMETARQIQKYINAILKESAKYSTITLNPSVLTPKATM